MTTDDINRSYRRWQVAEEDGRDDDADEEFRLVYGATLPDLGVHAAFTARTMEAVAAAAAKEARRAKTIRIASVAAGLAVLLTGGYFGAGVLVSLASTVVAGGFDLLIALVVRTAGAAQTGAGLWSVLSGVGRAAASFAADPTVTMTLVALQGLAVGALLALQRLLGGDEESLK
jgi:hypothetical protein